MSKKVYHAGWMTPDASKCFVCLHGSLPAKVRADLNLLPSWQWRSHAGQKSLIAELYNAIPPLSQWRSSGSASENQGASRGRICENARICTASNDPVYQHDFPVEKGKTGLHDRHISIPKTAFRHLKVSIPGIWRRSFSLRETVRSPEAIHLVAHIPGSEAGRKPLLDLNVFNNAFLRPSDPDTDIPLPGDLFHVSHFHVHSPLCRDNKIRF